MISGVDLNKTVDFTLDNDKDNPTIWKLGIVPSSILGQLSTKGFNSEIEMAYKLLQISIKGWENCGMDYRTIEETVYGRKMQVVPVELLDRLSLPVITALSAKVLEINGLTGEERKN